MTYLAIGAAALFVLLLGARVFASADPVLLAKVLRWSLVVAGVLLALYLFFRGQALLAAAPAAVAAISWRLLRVVPMGLWFRLFQMGKARARQRRYSTDSNVGGSQRSTVESTWLRMTLDHATGDLTGEVLTGFYVGQLLDNLDETALERLIDECRAEESSIQLLENYFDRRFGPEWRENFGKDSYSRRPSSGDMSRNEAYEILGLKHDASEEEVREAHRKLMINNHPDHGGSAYLATKINRARDVLLDK